MIIQLNQDLYRFGYLPTNQRRAFSLFFQGGNVAFRREAVQRIGGYDPELPIGEDVDIGIRLSAEGELFFNPRAAVVHTSQFSLRKVLSHWWNGARYQVQLFCKHGDTGVEFFLPVGSAHAPHASFRCVYSRVSRFTAVVFLTPLFVLHVMLLVALGYRLLCGPLTFVLRCVLFAAAIRYFADDLRQPLMPWSRRMLLAPLRLAVNELLFWVSLVEGLRRGILFLSFSK